MRSSYNCQDVGDVALYFDLEEFYIMKRSGNIVMYDANTKTETLKVANENPHPPALEAEEALDRNPLQGPPNPPAIGPVLVMVMPMPTSNSNNHSSNNSSTSISCL